MNQRCPCVLFFFFAQLLTPGRPYVGPTSPLTGVWSQTWGFLTFGLKVAKNKPNLPQVGLEKDAKASLYVMRNIERNRKTSTCARRFRRQNWLSQGAALSAEWMCFVWNRGNFGPHHPFGANHHPRSDSRARAVEVWFYEGLLWNKWMCRTVPWPNFRVDFLLNLGHVSFQRFMSKLHWGGMCFETSESGRQGTDHITKGIW